MEYPLLAALRSPSIDEIYVSTDSDDIKKVVRERRAFVIDRPAYLCTDEALVCLSIVKPRCLEDINHGVLPQRWTGRKFYPIEQDGGLDVDYEWQIPQVEYWLRKQGFTEGNVPYK